MLTVKLNNGVEVLAKEVRIEGKVELSAITYANHTQAMKKATTLGPGWLVRRFTRPFYVCKIDH
jgi:hypothetical protein